MLDLLFKSLELILCVLSMILFEIMGVSTVIVSLTSDGKPFCFRV